jgi:cytoskeletal protein CcmA (bactofilin family)
MGKTKEKGTDPISTFLGVETAIEGAVSFTGTIRLDGKVTGKIESQSGTVIIGEKAVIEADIAAGVVIVMGRVKGMIDASSRIEVFPPAQIDGDIQAPVISMDAGVKFNGKCTMKGRNGSMDKGIAISDGGKKDDKGNLKNFPKNL